MALKCVMIFCGIFFGVLERQHVTWIHVKSKPAILSFLWVFVMNAISFFFPFHITSKANITGPMKVWLYNHFIVAFITWPFMIYDLPISFGEKPKAVATKYLKRWLGITTSITESVLYRSKDHFGLGLIDLVTHLKKMQVCRMHMLRYSQDGSSNNLYE